VRDLQADIKREQEALRGSTGGSMGR